MDSINDIIANINYDKSISFEIEGVHVEYVNESNIPYIVVITFKCRRWVSYFF